MLSIIMWWCFSVVEPGVRSLLLIVLFMMVKRLRVVWYDSSVIYNGLINVLPAELNAEWNGTERNGTEVRRTLRGPYPIEIIMNYGLLSIMDYDWFIYLLIMVSYAQDPRAVNCCYSFRASMRVKPPPVVRHHWVQADPYCHRYSNCILHPRIFQINTKKIIINY